MIRWPRWSGDRIERRLSTAQTIGDLRQIARRRTPRPVFDFVDGGAGEEGALRRNTELFRRVRFVPRSLRNVSTIDTSCSLLGHDLALPIVLAPVGMLRIAHTHGEIGAARAATRAGIPWAMSTMATTTLESVATHAPDSDRWFQLYLWRDHEASKRLAERARAAGFSTLVLTVDVPVGGARLRDLRNGMTFPPSLTLPSTIRIARYPGWWFDALTRDPIVNVALQSPRGDFLERTKAVMDPAVTFESLDRLRETWDGRILVKGLLSPEDARMVIDHGADGVIISNHGGRQLENAISPLEVLPAFRAALGPDIPILIDGGIQSGNNVAAAVAAGADAVLIGRAYLYGLMAGGERGIDRAIDILRDDLERTMALMGAPSLADLAPEMVRLPKTCF